MKPVRAVVVLLAEDTYVIVYVPISTHCRTKRIDYKKTITTAF